MSEDNITSYKSVSGQTIKVGDMVFVKSRRNNKRVHEVISDDVGRVTKILKSDDGALVTVQPSSVIGYRRTTLDQNIEEKYISLLDTPKTLRKS